MTSAFSSDERRVIETQLHVSEELVHTSDDDILTDKYSIRETLDFVLSRGLQKVALQFPDESLADSIAVEKQLTASCPNTRFFILADTSYGATVVDFIAAEHIGADGIVHYGDAVLGSHAEIPVLYVFQKHKLDIARLETIMKLDFGAINNIIVVLHSSYFHVLGDKILWILQQVEQMMASLGGRNWRVAKPSRLKRAHNLPVFSEEKLAKPTVEYADRPLDSESDVETARQTDHSASRQAHGVYTASDIDSDRSNTCSLPGGVRVTLPAEVGSSDKSLRERLADYSFLYIGPKGPQLSTLVLTMSQSSTYAIDPSGSDCTPYTLEKQGSRVNQDIRKRFFLVQKAKDADVFGIVITSFGLSRYGEAVDRCKQLIENAGRKHYVFVVGKLNEAKLGNFPEVDVFVLIASPQDSLMDSKEYPRPLITLFELDLALNSDREWTGDFNPDFEEVLDTSTIPSSGAGGLDGDEEDTHFSLVSGRIRDLRVGQISDLKATIEAATIGSGKDARPTDVPTSLVPTQAAGALISAESLRTPGATFYSDRHYHGLDPRTGQSEVGSIVEGRSGIASHYTTDDLQRESSLEEDSEGDVEEGKTRSSESTEQRNHFHPGVQEHLDW